MTDETEQTPSIEIQTRLSPRLQSAALLAEIMASFAIIVSLIFVGLQIQQNTKATRAASAFEVNRMMAQNTLGYSLDANASLLNRKLFDPSTPIEAYNEEERARADMLILGTPGGREYWENSKAAFGETVVAAIDKNLRENPIPVEEAVKIMPHIGTKVLAALPKTEAAQ